MRRALRLAATASLLGLIGLGGCGESTNPDPDDLPVLNHDPILFVHGSGGDKDTFAAMRARFVADGWQNGVELFSFTYSSVVTNAANAQAIRNHVKHIMEITGAGKVDIISHEMGSLSSRFYIRNFGGLEHVDAWVSLGGPNHGTTKTIPCTAIPCQEMDASSSFITALNAVVEGPPPARYATWRSPCDEIVEPRESVSVWDAANFLTACMSNGDIIKDAGVYEQVKSFVE